MPHPTDAYDDAPMFAADAFRLSDAQAGLIDKARGFGKRVLAPRAAQHDRDATFPIENFRDMHGEGLLSICIPKERPPCSVERREVCSRVHEELCELSGAGFQGRHDHPGKGSSGRPAGTPL